MSDLLDPRIAAWVAPIPGTAPSGIDARYEPLHEAVRAQISLLDAVSGGEVDWDRVRTDAGRLLSATSKDLLVASYLAFALFKLEGLRGLAIGFQTMARMSDVHWEGMFPPEKRARARVNAIDWLTERVELALKDWPVSAADRPAVKDLVAAIAELNALVNQRFEDPSPAMRPVRDVVARIEMSLPAEAPPPAPPPAPAPLGQAEPPPSQPVNAAVVPTPGAAPAPAAAPALAAPAPVDLPATVDRLAEMKAAAGPLVAPIPGPAPAGADARYDPMHEGIRTEVAKLESVTDSAVDWELVQSRATTLLTAQSKDILIAVYYAASRMEQGGLPGLAQGLVALAEVMNTYWDEGFPEKRREKARANAVSWLVERALPLGDMTLTADDRDGVERVVVAAKHLADVVRDRFTDQAPATRPLTEMAQRLQMSVPKPAPKVEPKPAAPPPPAAPSPATSAPAPVAPPAVSGAAKSVSLPEVSGDVADPAQITEFLQKVGASLHKASRSIFGVSPADPVAYRLARVGLYLHLAGPPPAQSGQKTAVPPPAGEQVQQLEKLASMQNWAPLLEEAESALGPKRFWLDLHRYVALALGGMGHTAARDAVVLGTAELVGRMPELRELAFADGTPFASSATQGWLDDEVLPSSGGGGAEDPLAAQFGEARKLAGAGKGADAVALLDSLARALAAGRDRFRARLAMAQACAASGAHAAADGIYTALGADIERHQLSEWEPTLAADCYAGHHAALKALLRASATPGLPAPSPNNPMTAKLAVVYGRLCAVDPVAALKLGD